MISTLLQSLAGYIVEALCARFGIKDAADLEAFLANIVRKEMPDLSALDNLPNTIAAAVTAQLAAVAQQINGIPTQVINAIKGLLPFGGRQ